MQTTYDVAVVGGGLSGLSCALRAAWDGARVLLVERRPALGWESTWAGQLDWSDGNSGVAQRVLDEVRRVGGLRGNVVDAPILEMALDRLTQQAGVRLLLYTWPVQLVCQGDTALGVVLGNREGEQVVQAQVIVDATEEALLWSQTGVEVAPPTSLLARYSVFMNHAEGRLHLPLDLGGGISLHPSVWGGEVQIEFAVDEATILAARRRIPDVLRRVRSEVVGLKDALVTHTANEPFPTTPLAQLQARSTVHPRIQNLLGVGIWAAEVANTPVGRLDLGEKVGALVPQYRQLERETQSLTAGSAFQRPEFSSDVLVIGGGTAGAIAAIAAAREGVKTTLIEASLALGGIGTAGAIHYYYHGLSGGLQDEVDQRVAELTPLFCGKWGVQGFHPEAKKQVLQDMAEEAGVAMHFDTVVTGVLLRGGEVQRGLDPGRALATRQDAEGRNELLGVLAATPGGVAVFEGHILIDSTGDGDVAAMAGAPFTVGRDKDSICHTFSQPAGKLDAKSGALRSLNFDAGYVDPMDVKDLTRARRHGIQLYWRESFTPETRLLYIAPMIGIRQGRQIVGEYQLTLGDEVAGRQFDDTVSFMQAHYDNHSFDYENESDQATLWVWVLGNWLKSFGCEIPYRCLLPQHVDRLLLASRALSMTYDATHAFRMQKDIQRIGEAAALAAVQAVKKGVLPRQIDVGELQSVLKARGVLDERHRPKPAIPEPRRLALPDPDSMDAEQAGDLAWLSMRRPADVVPVLKEALGSGDPEVRFKASVALATRGVEEGLSLLRQHLEERTDETPDGVRTVPLWQAAIPFLGIAGDEQAVPALLSVLDDPQASLDALTAAVRAVGRIGDKRAIAPLEALFGREDLPTTRTFRSVPDVAPAVEDARWQLELAAAEALVRLGVPTERVRALIGRYLEDDRAYVRRYADRVLKGTRTP